MALYDMSLDDIINTSMKTGPSLLIVMGLVLGMSGCVRRDGRNSECKWPGEVSNHAVSARHLSADAEFAEDLAIRYADAHFGPRSPNPSETYEAERDQCMERLFVGIAAEHGVPVGQVSGSLGKNRTHIDLEELLPFALIYVFSAIVVARRIWRRYPPEDGYTAGLVMSVFVSLAFAVGAIIVGEQWNWFMEGHRIGNNHMSYRVWRMFWPKHRLELFVAGLFIFWLTAIDAAHRTRVESVNER